MCHRRLALSAVPSGQCVEHDIELRRQTRAIVAGCKYRRNARRVTHLVGAVRGCMQELLGCMGRQGATLFPTAASTMQAVLLELCDPFFVALHGRDVK